jgi:hypothetical protein
VHSSRGRSRVLKVLLGLGHAHRFSEPLERNILERNIAEFFSHLVAYDSLKRCRLSSPP